MTEVKKRGRPRKSDPNKALQCALNLFWEKGYDGTSLSDLVQVTGMAKPSLYATFGDKESFFLKALTQYIEEAGAPIQHQLTHPAGTVSDDLRLYLTTIATSVSDDDQPGCFAVNSLVDCANAPNGTKALLDRLRAERLDALTARLERGKDQGDLPADSDVIALAEFFWGQTVALGVLGRAGESQDALMRIIDTAMTVLPANPA